MKTKYFILAALAGLTFAGCSSDDLIAEAPPVNVNEGEAPIVFTSNQKAFTRADFEGKAAAEKLGNKFVVSGYKGTYTEWGKNSTTSTTVFDNYLVNWAENTANTTESNTNNWEYVGKGVIKHAVDNGITKQTIKYWDYSVGQYDFIAWSTGSKNAIYEGTPTTGQVLVSAITPATATSTKAYTFEGEAEDLKECYISDLVTVYKGNVTGSPTYNVVANGYQQPVTLKFRQLGTKVRIGLYETVPGYSVKDVKFYSAATADLVKTGDVIPGSVPATNYDADGAAAANASAKIFTTVANGIYKEGKYTVTFPTVDDPTDADNNQAHVEFTPAGTDKQKTTVDWGALNYTYRESGESSKEPIYLGRTSNTASFAGNADNNYYVVYLPNQTGTNLNLRVNYTLESIDGSKETIVVKGATAQVPSIYTAWKPGYAYTYLFKISDKTNGYTGVYDPENPDDTSVNSDPAGLYPITFDAIVVNAEDADGNTTQETITTVSTPSITTYQKGSKVVNKNEYEAATGDIYVTVNDANAATYEAVTGLTVGTSSVANYYTKDGSDNYIRCAANAVAEGGTTYYKKIEPALPNGNLATLTDKVALYTIPAGKTEAEVVDALQLQDENAPTAATGAITGRSGLVLTPAKKVTDAASISAANDYALTNSVEYGVDGNAISVGTDQAMRFKPEANKTYAFVYTKTAASNTTTKKYQPVTKTVNNEVGANVYRYAYKNATPSAGADTPDTGDDIYDAQKGVKYFSQDAGVYKMETAFIGQNVSNAYIKDGSNYVLASGYAVTGTEYYYTTNNGISYTKAHNEAYAQFSTDVTNERIYTYDGTNYTKVTGISTPVANTAYYYLDPSDSKYYWCIFLPQQTQDWYELDETAEKVLCGATERAIDGQTYFDKYEQNDGVYYVKVIKVQ